MPWRRCAPSWIVGLAAGAAASAMRPSRSAAELLVGPSSQGVPAQATRRKSSMQMQADSRMAAAVERLEELTRHNSRSKVQLEQHVLHSNMTKVEFGHATGEHGLEWMDMIVTRVTGQARRKGVRVGWKIYQVDGKSVQSDDEIFLRLQDAKWQWRSCDVWFITDMISIRQEQARDRAEKIQAEAERLARLPFEGVNDATHMEQVAAEFTTACQFDRLEDRAVTLAQLHRVIKWTGAHCHRWRDRVTKLKLKVDTMCLQNLNHWLLMPATKDKGCSFMELLAKERQTPNWFVICSFGEQLEGFVQCLKLQARTRKLGADATFWIAAFAYRQHSLSLEQDLSDDPRKSGFFRAMATSDFKVLMTLDVKMANGMPMTPFTRIWCEYEALQVCDQTHAVFDIACFMENKATLITMGLTDEEKEMEASTAGSGCKAKAEREKVFNSDIIDFGLRIHMQRAESTNFEHRVRILNSLSKREPLAAPLEDHESYRKANKRLQGLFALANWRRIMTANAEPQSEMQKLQERLADALRNDTWRETLDLSISFTPGNIEKLALLARSFSPSLRELKLDMKAMGIGDDSMPVLAASLPAELETLRLDLSQNPEITNWGVTTFVDKLPPKMQKMSVVLKDTAVTKQFKDSCDTLDGIKKCILAEAQKGSICHTINLTPIQDKHRKGMNYTHELSKV